MTVSKRTRYEVFLRDNNTCRYCGEIAPNVKITIDHVMPVTLGGSDSPDNLVTACKDCNAGKSSMVPGESVVDDVAQDALRWSAAIQRAVKIKESEIDSMERLTEWFYDEWKNAIFRGRNIDMPLGYEQSIRTFYNLGLTTTLLYHAISVTAGQPIRSYDGIFKYFCGVCWGLIRGLRESAYETLESLDPQQNRRKSLAYLQDKGWAV